MVGGLPQADELPSLRALLSHERQRSTLIGQSIPTQFHEDSEPMPMVPQSTSVESVPQQTHRVTSQSVATMVVHVILSQQLVLDIRVIQLLSDQQVSQQM